MFKHTQTIHWQQPTNCLIMFDHFVGLVLKGLNMHLKPLIAIDQYYNSKKLLKSMRISAQQSDCQVSQNISVLLDFKYVLVFTVL